MKVFFSYSSLDKELAGQVKVELAYYGLEVFLAHEDIEPLAEWIDVIFAELKDWVVPLLSVDGGYNSCQKLFNSPNMVS